MAESDHMSGDGDRSGEPRGTSRPAELSVAGRPGELSGAARPGQLSGAARPGEPGSVGRPVLGVRANASRLALLPLRLFLAVTFVYAGLDKLTDSAFLSGSGPGSLHATLDAVRDTAATPWLVDLALGAPEAFAIVIACSELAVGLGTLFGMWARVAALGGALISLTFLLTVSWTTTPYYYGNDLPYLMAWLPLLMAGAPMYSVDAVLEARRRQRKERQLLA